MIIAHRGMYNNLDIPENSIKGFKEALKQNMTIEFDVRITSDNELVVFHDANLKRMVGIDSLIENLSFEEVKKLKLLDTDEQIHTFKEVLDLVDGKVLLDIEIKPTRKCKIITKKVIEILSQYNGKFLLKSFSPRIVKCLSKLNNTYTYGLLIKKKYPKKLQTFIMRSNLAILYSRPNFLAVHKSLIKTKRFKKLRGKYPIYVWTLKNIDELNKYKNYADHYICDNLPY